MQRKIKTKRIELMEAYRDETESLLKKTEKPGRVYRLIQDRNPKDSLSHLLMSRTLSIIQRLLLQVPHQGFYMDVNESKRHIFSGGK